MANLVRPFHLFVQGLSFWVCCDAFSTHGPSVPPTPCGASSRFDDQRMIADRQRDIPDVGQGLDGRGPLSNVIDFYSCMNDAEMNDDVVLAPPLFAPHHQLERPATLPQQQVMHGQGLACYRVAKPCRMRE